MSNKWVIAGVHPLQGLAEVLLDSRRLFSRSADIINLEDHLHQLCGQTDLLLLPNQRLDHVLLLHVWEEGEREGRDSRIWLMSDQTV